MTLDAWLKVNRMSARQFALGIKVAPSSLSLIMAEKRNPTYGIVRAVYEATEGQVGLMDWPAPRAA